MNPPSGPLSEPLAPGLLPVCRRLLIVDDQPINIQALYQAFQDDHEVFMATSGEQALDFCRRDPPDLILLDVMMPGMDGLEVCRRLKADSATADIPVIFVTAQEDPADETRALGAGGVDFIIKPINRAVVRARVRTHLTLKAQADLLRSLAFIDGLTGVANRRRFDESLHVEWRHCQRGAIPLTLIMIDIDNFKHYNDLYGHQAGDACLQKVAAVIRAGLGRSHDLVARYGGEEFVCLLPDCAPQGAARKAEALRQAVAALDMPHESSATAALVTISVGAATCIPDANTNPDQLLAAADAALYTAKTGGRNRVCETVLGKLAH